MTGSFPLQSRLFIIKYFVPALIHSSKQACDVGSVFSISQIKQKHRWLRSAAEDCPGFEPKQSVSRALKSLPTVQESNLYLIQPDSLFKEVKVMYCVVWRCESMKISSPSELIELLSTWKLSGLVLRHHLFVLWAKQGSREMQEENWSHPPGELPLSSHSLLPLRYPPALLSQESSLYFSSCQISFMLCFCLPRYS